MAASSALPPDRVEEVFGEEPRLVFSCPSDPLAYRGSWQDRPIGQSPLAGIRLSYYNNSKTIHNSNILQVILRDHGFARVELPDDDWNIFWCAGQVNPVELKKMKPHQRINKFPKASALTLKANLWSNYARMQRRFGSDIYNFMPTTFLIPSQLAELRQYIHVSGDDGADPNKVWIVKPAAAYCGRGITLHRSSPEMPEALLGQRGVASKYVDPPFLLDGLKSDIRLYVLVSSWHPLTVYQYNEGLARFATEKYTLDDIEGRCAHLTNYSLNKHSASFVNDDSEASGSKWSLDAFKRRLALEIGETKASEVWKQVDDLIVKIMIAVEPVMVEGMQQYVPGVASGEPNKQCFQVFGFDVMLDADAKPWLLEVNLDPALKTDSPLDLRVKTKMLVDLLNTISVPIPPGTKAHNDDAYGGTFADKKVSASAAASDWPASVRPSGKTCGDLRANVDGNKSKVETLRKPYGGSKENIDDPEVLSLQNTESGWVRVTPKSGEEAVLNHINAEYRRSKSGGWRRLFPSSRSAEYLPLLEPSRTMHSLPFEI